jgi:peptidyl-prolyl cis-trans isomerase A (cyclophilin A)
MLRWLFGFALGVGALIAACSSSTSSEGAPDAGADVDTDAAPPNDEDSGSQKDALPPNPLPECPQDPGPPATTATVSPTDPIGGAEKFTLAQALAGYPQVTGVLTALITTEQGKIRCDLDEAAAPISVANFVGLARGTRPYEADIKKWKVGRFYDGLVWHRVIPGFVIQGGDPDGKGSGGPGYDLVVENQVPELFGTLAMAAAETPSGSQFYIVVGKGPAPEYNVFGRCETATAMSIAAQPRDDNDKPLTPIHMQRIDIARCPTGIADPGDYDAGADAGTDASTDADAD